MAEKSPTISEKRPGVIPIENKDTRPDWNAIRAEYISGVSIRKLAEKYGVSRSCIERKCKAEQWTKSRNEARDKATAKAVQKTADAAASNAAKMERARGILLDLTLGVLEKYPRNAGNKLRTFGKDTHGNDIMTEFELAALASVLERLGKNSVMEAADDPLMKMLEAWNNAGPGQ